MDDIRLIWDFQGTVCHHGSPCKGRNLVPLVNLGSLIIGGGNQDKLNMKQKIANKVEPETASWNIGKENVRLCCGTVGVGAEQPRTGV